MAETVTWLGVVVTLGGVMGVVGSLLIYGLLTPTARSPARPGDLEGRSAFLRQCKVEVTLVGVGAVAVAVGLVLQVA